MKTQLEKSSSKVFYWPIRVYYEDTDCGGIVYHANYVKFFERGRTEFLREFGLSQQELMKQNVAFVVSRMDINFKRAARLDDMLIVSTQITQVKHASFIFYQRIEDDNHKIYCEATVKIASVNPTEMKSQVIPSAILTEIKRVS